MDLREDLITYIKTNNLQASEVAKSLNIDYQRMSKWLQRKSHPKDSGEKQKIHDLVSGKVPLFQHTQTSTTSNVINKFQLVLNKENRQGIILPNTHISSGTISFVDNSPAIILEYIEAPFIGSIEGAAEIAGDSMAPTLRSGDRVAIKELKDKKLLMWGELYYLIDTNFQGTVKRLYEWEHGVILVSDNPDQVKYPPVRRTWEQIEAIFRVKADITKH